MAHPEDSGIADNLRGHNMAEIKEAVKAVGAHIRYLPHILPISNPIEQLFAKLNAVLRTTATRTVDRRWNEDPRSKMRGILRNSLKRSPPSPRLRRILLAFIPAASYGVFGERE